MADWKPKIGDWVLHKGRIPSNLFGARGRIEKIRFNVGPVYIVRYPGVRIHGEGGLHHWSSEIDHLEPAEPDTEAEDAENKNRTIMARREIAELENKRSEIDEEIRKLKETLPEEITKPAIRHLDLED